VAASTGIIGSSVSSKSSIAVSSSSTSSACSCVATVEGVGGAGATPASSTAGVSNWGCDLVVFVSTTGTALLEPLRVKTVLNLSKARPKLVRLPAALSAAGCCGESSCAPDDMVIIACQVLSFQADPAVAKVREVLFENLLKLEGPNSREQVMGRNDAIKPDRRCREPALWATQAKAVRLLNGGKLPWVL